MSLSVFLNPVKEDNLKVAVSKRFRNEDGKPVEWELKAITTEEDEALRKSCTRKIPVNGKYGQYTEETDFNMYLGKLSAACTVYPNLNAVELQNAYNAMGADKLLKAMLKPGEYANYLKRVQEANGFDEPMNELMDEAKN